jgi:hypothetical protein
MGNSTQQNDANGGTPLAGLTGSPTIRGFLSFHAGVKVGDNPYREKTEEFWKWMVGWASALLVETKAKMANTRLSEVMQK